MTNLQTNNKFQEIIKKYLDENASEVLTEKINSGSKTLADCEAYIKKEAQKQAKGGCACIEDAVVYGWVIHFFEEDEIKAPENAPKAEIATPKEEPKAAVKTEPKRTSEIKKEQKAAEEKDVLKTEQMSIFDFLGE